jgi:hypothetical protein
MSEIVLYKGKRLEEYSKEELIKIATEGWKLYHNQIQDSISSMKLLSDLHKAARNGL